MGGDASQPTLSSHSTILFVGLVFGLVFLASTVLRILALRHRPSPIVDPGRG